MQSRSTGNFRRAWLATIVAALLAAPISAAADAEQIDRLERRIEQLENANKELRIDTRKIEVAEEEAAKLKPLAGYDSGFFIQTPDGAFKFKPSVYSHFDGRFFIDNDDTRNTSQFLFRRARLDLKGTALKWIDFRLMTDFADSVLQLQDAYVDIRYFPAASLLGGKTKTPFGIERLQSATAIRFVERALPDNLVPNRDLGLMLHGDVLQGVLSYWAGVFNGVNDGRSGDGDFNSDKDFAGRVFVNPFINTSIQPLQGLSVGMAATFGNHSATGSTAGVTSYRSSGRQTFFRYVDSEDTGTVVASGDNYRLSPQATYYWGPFGLLTEYVSSTQEVRLNDAEDDLTHWGWQLQGSYVLTGEDATFRGVTPANPIDPLKGKWGAFEVAARFSQFDADNDAFSGGYASPGQSATSADNWALGLNWYWNYNLKFVLNYEETYFDGGKSGGADRDTERLLLTRIQLLI